MRSLRNRVVGILQILAQTLTTADKDPTNGVDNLGVEAVKHQLLVGADGATLSGTNHVAVIMQESVDDTTYTNVVTDGDVGGGTPDASTGILKDLDAPADAETLYEWDYLGSKPFSRLHLDVSGTISLPVATMAEKSYLANSAV